MSPGPPPSAGVGDRHGVGGKAPGTLEGRSVLYGRVAADDYDYPYLSYHTRRKDSGHFLSIRSVLGDEA
jgi:hypothetical protein